MPREVNPAFIRVVLAFRIPLVGVLDQAGAITYLDSFVTPLRAALERVAFIPDVAGAGAGATCAISVRKGAAAGTIIATVTPTLALHVLGGPGIVSTVAAADDQTATFKDGDLMSITKAAGTAFSAGGGTLQLTFRQRPQARS